MRNTRNIWVLLQRNQRINKAFMCNSKPGSQAYIRCQHLQEDFFSLSECPPAPSAFKEAGVLTPESEHLENWKQWQ